MKRNFKWPGNAKREMNEAKAHVGAMQAEEKRVMRRAMEDELAVQAIRNIAKGADAEESTKS